PRPAPARRPLRPEDAKLIRSLVLHEDAHLIVLEKPPGLAVQGGTGTHRHVDGMLDALAKDGERPKLVHRLDKETSGILVVARTAAAARFLTAAFRAQKVRKLYWAVVVGEVRGQEGVIDLALAKRGGVLEKMAADEEGKYARTRWRVIQRSGKVGAWLGLMPLTGRTHQIRAHCAAMGWPILGDGKYGGKAAHPGTAPPGLMLHARELELPHPAGGTLGARAEPSRTFKDGLAWLGMQPETLPGSRLADWT
ncbi:MAG TPA: RluA family pseudouridine synthase, partial [Geminicoccaceae bacterium]|nr:RluA family pseudouridine synthase [Geminicoccaceae bacterium]